MTGFTRNFGPLLTGGYADQNMRVSDAERHEVTDRLAAHYGDGRLDQAEFDERVSRAMTAKTRGDLRGLLDDLPEPGPTGAPGTQVAGRGRRRRHPVLFLALLVLLAMTGLHAIVWVAVPWLWLTFIVVIALALTGHLGRPRAR